MDNTMAYEGVGPEEGKVIKNEDAFDYAFNRCLHGTVSDQEAFREMLVEWFYSGNWIKIKEDIYG